jgi:hypothetical protein
LHHAAPKATPEQEGVAHPMPPLWQELALDPENGDYCRFRNLQGAEYLRQVESLTEGLELQLAGYEHQVFHDFQLLDDANGDWKNLHQKLQGRAVDNLDRELLQMRYQPLWQAFTRLLDPGRLHVLVGGLTASPPPEPIKELLTTLSVELHAFATLLHSSVESHGEEAPAANHLDDILAILPNRLTELATEELPGKLLASAWHGSRTEDGLGVPILGWLLLDCLGKTVGFSDNIGCPESFRRFGLDFAWQESAMTAEQERNIFLTNLLLQTATLSPHPATCEAAFAKLCNDPGNARLLNINRHADETWFSQEGMTTLAGIVALQAEIVQLLRKPEEETTAEPAVVIADILRQRLARAAAVGYRLDKFLRLG